MAKNTNNNFQKATARLENSRQKEIVRVWGLAKRLDPKTMKEEPKKKGFSKIGNKGK